MKVKNDPPAVYVIEGCTSQTQVLKQEDECIELALSILESRLKKERIDPPFEGPDSAINFLKMKLATEERELFSVMFLDTRHHLIEYKTIFYGTIDQCAVHPREVIKHALKINAAAIILAHNHPSGSPAPSPADVNMTERIRSVCDLLDIRLLDHIIVGGNSFVSLAGTGKI